MSKAPHPHTPGRVERLSQDKVRELFPKWPDLEVVRIHGQPAADPTPWQVARAKGAELDQLAAERRKRNVAQWASERREDAQARSLYLRGWVGAAWTWMWGES